MNNTTNITCPKCGAEIPLTEAVSHNVREELAAQFDKQLHAEKQKLKADAMLKAQQNVSLELADLRNQVQEQQARLNQAQSAELELRRKQRELQTAHQNQELELARKLEAERLKIAAEARQQAIEAERLKLNEKELIIQGLTEQITALKQRAEQGSTQLQGEVLELDLEARLAAQFPGDGVEPVAKGQRGADVLQRVRSNLGHDCGTILWETKRARNWSKDWLSKLKEDQRAAKADLAVLVSQVLPAEVIGFGWFDGVWVCDPANAMPLAVALRQGVAQRSSRCAKTSRPRSVRCKNTGPGVRSRSIRPPSTPPCFMAASRAS